MNCRLEKLIKDMRPKCILIVLMLFFSCDENKLSTTEKKYEKDEYGTVISEISYIDTTRHGKAKYFFYGTTEIQEEREYKYGKLDGVSKFFSSPKHLFFSKSWKNNLLNGETIYYFENGQIESKIFYHNGFKLRSLSFYENGAIKNEKFFNSHDEVFCNREYNENNSIDSIHGFSFTSDFNVFYYDEEKKYIGRTVKPGKKVTFQFYVAEFPDKKTLIYMGKKGHLSLVKTENSIATYSYIFNSIGRDTLVTYGEIRNRKNDSLELKNSIDTYFVVK
jgi:hypothetical protein